MTVNHPGRRASREGDPAAFFITRRDNGSEPDT